MFLKPAANVANWDLVVRCSLAVETKALSLSSYYMLSWFIPWFPGCWEITIICTLDFGSHFHYLCISSKKNSGNRIDTLHFNINACITACVTLSFLKQKGKGWKWKELLCMEKQLRHGMDHRVISQTTHSTFQHVGLPKHLAELNSTVAAQTGSMCH